MTIPTEVIMKMATIGLSEEQAKAVADMLTAVEDATAAAAEASLERGREKTRARVAKWRETHASNVTKRNETLPPVTERLVGEGARVDDKTSNSEIEPQEENKKRANALSPEFDEFWALYPNKVGKPKAKLELAAALKRADFAAIMSGLRRYIATKPVDRAWLNPATFLHQDRFDDQPALPPMARGSPPPKSEGVQGVFRELRERASDGRNFDESGGAAGATVLRLPNYGSR